MLHRVALGESNAEIGAALYLSPATARTYVSRLLTKLGARDRAQLVVIAYESGLVAPGGPTSDRPGRLQPRISASVRRVAASMKRTSARSWSS